MEARFRGEYIDPLKATNRNAKEKKLSSQYEQQQSKIQENKQYINTNTTMKNKQRIILKGSQLRQLIKESIENIINGEDEKGTNGLWGYAADIALQVALKCEEMV